MDDAMSKGWFAAQAGHGEGALRAPRLPRARRRGRAHDPARGLDARRAARRPGDRRRDPAADRGAVDAAAHREGVRGAAPRDRVQALHRRVGEAPGASSPSGRTSSPSTCRTRSCSARRRSGRKAFADLGDEPPDTSSWYVSQHAFNYAVFSSAIDGFAVTSAGTLTSSPASTRVERVQRRRLLRRWRRWRRRRFLVVVEVT